MAYDLNKRLGNYQLLELLGQGGFADVYLGEHVYLKTSAAIKVMRLQLSHDALSQFLAEARTIARLRHPHIVVVHDFGIEQDVPFLVMGYAPYGSLRRSHAMGSVVPLDTVAIYVKQMAQALQHAHDQMIIHRDVKPENMLLGERQVLMLSDFGIAVAIQSMPSNPMLPKASNGEALGTTTYMAPELFTAEAVFASDQYSLGIVIYEWLCGTPPFVGSDMEIALQHAHIAAPSLKDKSMGLSDAVEQVVMRALAKRPEERFPSILDFAMAFERACVVERAQAGTHVAHPLFPPAFSSDQTEMALPPVTPVPFRALTLSAKTAIVPPAALSPAQNFVSAEVPVPPISLKLPAHSVGTTKRLSDYASNPGLNVVLGDGTRAKGEGYRAPSLQLPSRLPVGEQQTPSYYEYEEEPAQPQHEGEKSMLAVLKQRWEQEAVPAVKHLWIDQTVPTVRQFWTRQAVPVVKKLLATSLVSPDPQQQSLPPLIMRSDSQRLSTQSVPAMRQILNGQVAPVGSPPVVSRRVVIGGLAGLTIAGVAGVIATTTWQSMFRAEQVVPTPTLVPHAVKPTAAPTQAAPSPTATPLNTFVQSGTRPTAVSWGAGQMDLFVRGTDGGLWHRHYDGSWHAWEKVLDGLTFDPVITSWGAGRFDVFARGVDSSLQHSWFDGAWHPFESLGGALTSDPSAVSWGANRLDIFVRSVDNALWHKSYDGSWHDWERLDGVLLSSPSVATWGPNRLDVFVRGSDSALWHRGYDGSWHDWETLGGSFESDPGAVSLGPNHLDVFVRGTGNALQRRHFDGTWHDWETLSGILTSSPTAATWGTGRLDVFARTANNVLQETWYEGGVWQPWLSLS